MEQLWNAINGNISSNISPASVLLSASLSFILSHAIAWVYCYTHHGLSYSKSFVQSLIVISMVVSLVMTTIYGSFVIAVGLMGTLSIIRFRNVIKDTRDITYLLCVVAVGMACGTGRHSIAVTGAVCLCLVHLYLYASDFGSKKPSNAFLSFTTVRTLNPGHPVNNLIKQYTKTHTLISATADYDNKGLTNYAYQLMIKDHTKLDAFISQIESVEGITNLNLTMQEQLLEI